MDIKVDNDSVEKIVQGAVRAQVAEVLAKQSPRLIEEIVRLALSESKRTRYGKTVFEEQIGKALLDSATECCQEWIDEQKPKIRDAVSKRLNAKTKGLIGSIADQLVAGIRGGIKTDVWFQAAKERY